MKDRLVAVVLLVGSLAYVLAASGFESGFIADPIGPRAFPYGIGTLLVVACLALLFLQSGSGELPELSWRHGAALIALATYVLVLEVLGFVLATTVLAVAVARLFGGPMRVSVAVSFLLSVSIFVLFVYGLSIPLPWGF